MQHLVCKSAALPTFLKGRSWHLQVSQVMLRRRLTSILVPEGDLEGSSIVSDQWVQVPHLSSPRSMLRSDDADNTMDIIGYLSVHCCSWKSTSM